MLSKQNINCHGYEKVNLYADDVPSYITITLKNATTAIPELQSVHSSMDSRKLKLNPDVTHRASSNKCEKFVPLLVVEPRSLLNSGKPCQHSDR